MPLNLSQFHEIGNIGIIFDTRPCEIEDLAVSSRQMVPLPGILGKFLIELVNFDLVNSDFSLEIHAIQSYFE